MKQQVDTARDLPGELVRTASGLDYVYTEIPDASEATMAGWIRALELLQPPRS